MGNKGKTYRIDGEALDYVWYEMDTIIHDLLGIREEHTILRKFNAFSILKYAYQLSMFTKPGAVTNVNVDIGTTQTYKNIDCWFFLLLRGLDKLLVVVERTCGRTIFNELMEASTVNERLDIEELLYILGRNQKLIYVLDEDMENKLLTHAVNLYKDCGMGYVNFLQFLYNTACDPRVNNDTDHDVAVTRYLGMIVLSLYILSRYAKYTLAYHYCLNTIKYKHNYCSINNLHHTSDIKMKRLFHNRANWTLYSLIEAISDDSEVSTSIFNHETFRSSLYSILKKCLENDNFVRILDNYIEVNTVYIYGKEPVSLDGLYTRKVVEDILIDVTDKR